MKTKDKILALAILFLGLFASYGNINDSKIEDSKVLLPNKKIQEKTTFLKKEKPLFQEETTVYDAQRKVLWNREEGMPRNFMSIEDLVSIINTSKYEQNKLVVFKNTPIREKNYVKSTLRQNGKFQVVVFGITMMILFPLLYLFIALKKIT